MTELELIKMTHDIDRSLEILGAAMTEETLKKEVLEVRATWRELTFAITASLCGLSSHQSAPLRRRRRRRDASDDESRAQAVEAAGLGATTKLAGNPEPRRG